MLSKRVVVATLSLFLVLVLSAVPMFAQATSTGTVIGKVIDPSGAAVAGATVTITDLATKIARTTTSNAEGNYIFVNVPPGAYDVTVASKGFRTEKFSKQTVAVGQQLTLNATLQLGATTEVIEVSAAPGAELQTLNATVGTGFSGVALDNLPSISREASTFAMMQPGITPEGSVAGAVYDQNTFQLDGGQNTNDMDGSMNVYTPSLAGDPTGGLTNYNFTGTGTSLGGGGGPTGVMPTPIDSVEEFKVNTTGQTADFNSSAGAQVSMVTRKGGDSWHGTAYEYYLDNNFDANSFVNNAPASRAALPDYHYSRFGGSVGGPIIPKKILGGKTYFFGNYEGFRFFNSVTDNRVVPGPGLVQGLLSFGGTVYNLNNTTTTYNGPTIAGSGLVHNTIYPSAATQAACPLGDCDPRALGISPTMQALWALMPAPSAAVLGQSCTFIASFCDGINEASFTANVALPTNSNFAVARIDHDFGDKWHFFASWRFYRMERDTTNQTLVTAAGIESLAHRPQIPMYYVAGVTTNITTNLTNDFHYSYLKNWWEWGNIGDFPQLNGLGAALEPNGETTLNVLAPYNVNNQQTRQRYWDGHDHFIRDDMTRLLGNHVIQWGGTFQHNYNQHSRNDNGGSVNEFEVDQLGSTSAYDMTGYIPAGVSASAWTRYYSDVLGLLSTDQIVYPRSAGTLALEAAHTPIVDKVHIPYYNIYATDSWHFRPTMTLTYGLAWTLEMPPYEESGEQVALVDQADQLITGSGYIRNEKRTDQNLPTGTCPATTAAPVCYQPFNPEIGFATVKNAAGGLKYPYNPYYGSFSPRVGLAWNPNYDTGLLGSIFGHGKTVVRGGFSIIYGRLNGVDLVLAPLLGYGLLQTVLCVDPTTTGACPGTKGSTPLTGFRIGPNTGGAKWDGLTGPLPAPSAFLPQPAFPGINAVTAGSSEVLDPDFRPNKSYEFDFTVQRQLGSKFTVEAGYIGRVIRNEYQPLDLNAVPYMLTLGGQKFSNAYANLVLEYCGGTAGLAGGNCKGSLPSVTSQPFFETLLGGAGSAYCKQGGATSCTQAVAIAEGNAGTGNLSSQLVWNLWNDLESGTKALPSPVLAANGGALLNTTPGYGAGQLSSGVGDNTSFGFGNYNALFLTAKLADWHGVTMQSNFTYGKALGTGAVVQATSEYTSTDPFWIARGYGLQNWDRKFLYNMFMVYQPPIYKSQHGLVGHLLGGWSFAPIFVTGSGLPLTIFPASYNFGTGLWGQGFGEADTIGYEAPEEAVLVPGAGCSNFSTSRHNGVAGSGGVSNTGPYNVGLYTNPVTVFNCFRNPVLGLDTGHNGGYGTIARGQPFWNVDMQIRKSTHITERISGEFQVIFSNLFNHVQLGDPFNSLADPGDWGQLEAQANAPRTFEFGFRVRF